MEEKGGREGRTYSAAVGVTKRDGGGAEDKSCDEEGGNVDHGSEGWSVEGEKEKLSRGGVKRREEGDVEERKLLYSRSRKVSELTPVR